MKKIFALLVFILLAGLTVYSQSFTGRLANKVEEIRKGDTTGVVPVFGNNTVGIMMYSTDSTMYRWMNTSKKWVALFTGGSSFYQTVQSNTTSQTQRAKLNFGTEFTATDNSGNGSTDITVNAIAESKVTSLTADLASKHQTLFIQTANQAVSNTSSFTTLYGSGNGSLVFAANSITAGKVIHLKGYGILTTASSGPTVSFQVQGPVNISTGPGSPLAGSLTNQQVEWDISIVCRTTGSSGTGVAAGYISIQGVKYYYTATVSINTTISNTLDYQIGFGTADPSNAITSYFNQVTLE